jgi:hypothetical protein
MDSKKERMRILEHIECGDVSVDEGLPAHQAKTGAEATAIHIELSLASQTNRVVLTDVWEQNPKP